MKKFNGLGLTGRGLMRPVEPMVSKAKGDYMDRKKIAIVKSEMRRLQARISELEISATSDDAIEYNWQYPKETGAVRRSSMDLTRALANMRKAN